MKNNPTSFQMGVCVCEGAKVCIEQQQNKKEINATLIQNLGL